jgi:hypothetical protein
LGVDLRDFGLTQKKEQPTRKKTDQI